MNYNLLIVFWHYIFPLIITSISKFLTSRIIDLKNRKIITYILIINILTTLLLCFGLSQTGEAIEKYRLYYLYTLELLVIIIESNLLKLYLKEMKLPFLRISFVLNSVSFLVCLWIYILLTGDFLQ